MAPNAPRRGYECWSRPTPAVLNSPAFASFLPICAERGYYVTFGDVENAYQQSPPPSIDCFLEVDDVIYDWYLHKFNKKLNRLKDVIPLHRALQGPP